jgi:hypothetical protein
MFCEEEQVTCNKDDTDVCCNIIGGYFLNTAPHNVHVLTEDI